LGASIANWSFLVFSSIFILILALRWRDGFFRAPTQ
jgi:hypothetical protein